MRETTKSCAACSPRHASRKRPRLAVTEHAESSDISDRQGTRCLAVHIGEPVLRRRDCIREFHVLEITARARSGVGKMGKGRPRNQRRRCRSRVFGSVRLRDSDSNSRRASRVTCCSLTSTSG